ncbi:hypothetical protein BGW38_003696 [Lunasporangiospora selenospora]|uniref:FAD-binding FR-type domain-containing protein n=1 Tax=Lunasporangiospora selenospora TaxID=979761 RepID=A0A9P6FR30_9FUNG|nr:hypothetical protein BGW38_003696 [Lunasporangiospora selenospora]
MARQSTDWQKVIIGTCLFVVFVYTSIEGFLTWVLTREWIFNFTLRDYGTSAFLILPSCIGHLATVWGHYFRSEREFQHSIAKVTTPASVKQKISLWEHHIWWGYTVKYWILVGSIVVMNIAWVLSLCIKGTKELFEEYSMVEGIGLTIGYMGGYAAVASCTLILFLILRRSMLHAIGFTYSEILPLHRWLGVAIVFWSTLHTVGYVMYYSWNNSLAEEFSFDDVGRSVMNICGCFAFGALVILAIFSIPQIRRKFYIAFMGLHRVMTVIFLIGTIVHYPYYMLWYYVLPSFILFLVDRFVPKIIQRKTLHPEASCTLNADADIVRMTFRSHEPMKPYYPGDYIMVQIPELGTLYHPFTIASYWPENPQEIVLFIRTYNTKLSWTGALGRLCGTNDKRVMVKSNVDGVFGDRRHDYLKSDVMVIFVAGAAITTFMSLIKAIGAQIAASEHPLRMRLHLICTFRTRSELHAYGSFLHQLTRDPRFTSWLKVEIYVSRPDKPQTLMGSHAHVIKNDIQVPGPSAKERKPKKRFSTLRRTGTMLKRALSGRTMVHEPTMSERNALDSKDKAPVSPTSASSHIRTVSVSTVASEKTAKAGSGDCSQGSSNIEQVYEASSSCTSPTLPPSPTFQSPISKVEHEAESSGHGSTNEVPYATKRLPTFQDAHSTSVATKYAKLDLHATTILIVIPLAFWFVLRAIKWEGSVHFCDIMAEMDPTQMKICYGAYSTAPIFIHYLLVSIMGYLAMWYARRLLVRGLQGSRDLESARGPAGSNASSDLPYPEFDMDDEKLTVEDGNWDEGDVVFSRGRVNVKRVIEQLMEEGIGTKGEDRALVTVFGGGPEAFVEHVGKTIKKTGWVVDFHRETWAP